MFGAVVALNSGRLTSPLDDLIKRSDNSGGLEREVHFNTQAFAVVIVDDVKGSKFAPIGQGVAHEVHRPH